MINIGIRGVGGLLGTRLLRWISQQPDMSVSFGITDDNPSAITDLVDLMAWGNRNHKSFWDVLFFDGSEERRNYYNQSYGLDLQPLDHLDLKTTCNILIDTAAPAPSAITSHYSSFPGYVLLQDSAYPAGRAISLPFVAPESTSQDLRVFRQGDCAISGLCPVIGLFRDHLVAVQIPSLLRLSTALVGKYLTNPRTSSVRINLPLAQRVGQQLFGLTALPVEVHDVLHVPQIDYYVASLVLVTDRYLTVEEVCSRLVSAPRIWLYRGATYHVGTYALDAQLRLTTEQLKGKPCPPIVVFSSLVETLPESRVLPPRIHLRLAIRFEHITALAIPFS